MFRTRSSLLFLHLFLLSQEDRGIDPRPFSRKLCCSSAFVDNLDTKRHFHGDVRWNKTWGSTLRKELYWGCRSTCQHPRPFAPLRPRLGRLRTGSFVDPHGLRGGPNVQSSVPSPGRLYSRSLRADALGFRPHSTTCVHMSPHNCSIANIYALSSNAHSHCAGCWRDWGE